MEGRALPPRPPSASSEGSTGPLRFRTQFSATWTDSHGTLGLAKRMELDQAMTLASETAIKADSCEPQRAPSSSSSTRNFTRILYELDYASRDLQGAFQASSHADHHGNLRHQLKASHWGQHYNRYHQAFDFLTSIDNAGWNGREGRRGSITAIPITQIDTEYEAWDTRALALPPRGSLAQSPPVSSKPRTSKQLKMIKNLRPVEAMLNDSKLQSKEWFHGLMNRKEAEKLLRPMLTGAYLFRISTSHKGLTLSVVTSKGCKHYLIHYQEGSGYFIFGKSKAFRHINDLVRYYNANAITGINTMLIFPAQKAEADEDVFGSAEPNYAALLEEQLDPEVFAVVEDLARERREAEQRAALNDPLGSEGDSDPVLSHGGTQPSNMSSRTSQPRPSWFRSSVARPARPPKNGKSHPDIGPPIPIRGSVKGNGKLGREGRASASRGDDDEGSFGFAPVLTKEELRARIIDLDDAIGKETRIAQAAARLHDQPGSGAVQIQRRSEAEISMARLASLQASRREYQQQLAAP